MKKLSNTEAALAELAALEARRTELLKQIQPQTSAVKTPRVPLWMLIQRHLQEVGGMESLESLVAAMVNAGHELGKYPKRTVRNSVSSPALAGIFRVTEATRKGVTFVNVALLSSEAPYMPAPMRSQR